LSDDNGEEVGISDFGDTSNSGIAFQQVAFRISTGAQLVVARRYM
jgi:hypothetical protein